MKKNIEESKDSTIQLSDYIGNEIYFIWDGPDIQVGKGVLSIINTSQSKDGIESRYLVDQGSKSRWVDNIYLTYEEFTEQLKSKL